MRARRHEHQVLQTIVARIAVAVMHMLISERRGARVGSRTLDDPERGERESLEPARRGVACGMADRTAEITRRCDQTTRLGDLVIDGGTGMPVHVLRARLDVVPEGGVAPDVLAEGFHVSLRRVSPRGCSRRSASTRQEPLSVELQHHAADAVVEPLDDAPHDDPLADVVA